MWLCTRSSVEAAIPRPGMLVSIGAVGQYFAGLEDWQKAAPAFELAVAAIQETA